MSTRRLTVRTSVRRSKKSSAAGLRGAHYGRSNNDVFVNCEGYLRMKKRTALRWSTRFVVLRGNEMRIYSSKLDQSNRHSLLDVLYVEFGRISSRGDLSIEWRTKDGKEILGRAFNRGDLAKWVTAFYRLSFRSGKYGVAVAQPQVDEPQHLKDDAAEKIDADTDTDAADDVELRNPILTKQDVELRKSLSQGESKRRVAFHGSVMVRTIPCVARDQVHELYYSKAEMEKFCSQASSFLCRTEDAVSYAYQSLQSSLSFRRQID